MVRHFVHHIRFSVRKLFQKMSDESRKNEFYFILGIIISVIGNYIADGVAEFLRSWNMPTYWLGFLFSVLIFVIIALWVYADYFRDQHEKALVPALSPETKKKTQ